MTKYQSGFFAIQLNEGAFSKDTLVVNSCGGVKLSYPDTIQRIPSNFSFIIRSNDNITSVIELTESVKPKRKAIYYKNGFLMTFDDKQYLILKIGRRKELKERIEIDSPIFIKLIKEINKCW